MKPDVYVELPSTPSAPARIATRKGGGIQEMAEGSFKGNSQAKVVAFAPALAVSRFRIPIAAKSESEARRAALYAIEDEIAQPVEDVHLTLGPRSRGGVIRDVYIVDKSLMENWSGILRGLGLGHAPIVPENSFQHTQPAIYKFENRWLLAGTETTFGADGDLPQEAIDALIEAAGLTGARTVHQSSLAYLTEAYQQDPGVALANTGKASEKQNAGSQGGLWRLAATLAAAALLLWAGSVWIETNRLERAAALNDSNARIAYRSQFPNAPEPIDVHADVRQQMEQLNSSGNGTFRALAAALYKAIAGSNSVQLAHLNYSASDPGLKARLLFLNREGEDAFRTSLDASGLDVEWVGAANTPQGVEANIILRARP